MKYLVLSKIEKSDVTICLPATPGVREENIEVVKRANARRAEPGDTVTHEVRIDDRAW